MDDIVLYEISCMIVLVTEDFRKRMCVHYMFVVVVDI